ncbi:cytochrome c [Fulvivirgaceae bacterium PWU4]|uniref:Cytochrome c n=1 Tax=Chryseosolibacter histidini TaxID=2782349 RepID=A0AAP2GQX0_9BACT|nr:cytochrome c [Chryseosolibacter histidini]MBT1699415.1 cytochrome c [Chryseosolibacter histidini]
MKKIVSVVAFIAVHAAVLAQSADKASIERGKTVYESTCLACHQADGSGVPNLNPPLIKTKWTLGDKNQLINVVLKGLDEEIEVDGETYHNVMPPLNYLSDQEIADVLTYVRNNFGNKASAIKEADVKALREK